MSNQTQTKENAAKWSGSLGFIMAAAGSAVGMGNLWRFPMLVGENGGGAFVLVYLICIFLVGIPMIIAEVTIGRAGGKDAFGSYKALNKMGRSRNPGGYYQLYRAVLLCGPGWMGNPLHICFCYRGI